MGLNWEFITLEHDFVSHPVSSQDDALDLIAEGTLGPDTLVTIYGKHDHRGRKVAARDLPQLAALFGAEATPDAPPSPPADPKSAPAPEPVPASASPPPASPPLVPRPAPRSVQTVGPAAKSAQKPRPRPINAPAAAHQSKLAQAEQKADRLIQDARRRWRKALLVAGIVLVIVMLHSYLGKPGGKQVWVSSLDCGGERGCIAGALRRRISDLTKVADFGRSPPP